MEANVSEIADGIYRLSTFVPDIAPLLPAHFGKRRRGASTRGGLSPSAHRRMSAAGVGTTVIGARLDRAAQTEFAITQTARALQKTVDKMRRTLLGWNARLGERHMMRLAPCGEEILQQRGSLASGDAAVNFGLVVAGWR
jgi:hypothetical protein